MLKIIAIAIASAVAGTLAALVMLLVTANLLPGNEPVSTEDLFGIGMLTFMPGLAMCGLLYAPALIWLRRKRGGCEPRLQFLLVPALMLKLPAYILLIVSWVRGTGFAGFAEISLFFAAFIVTGLTFGAAFARFCRIRTFQRSFQ